MTIQADKGKIEMALFQLLANSLKHTQKDGKITIRLSRTSKSFSITVSDNGCGISSAKLTSIWSVGNPEISPNTDGLNFECCKRGLIEDCDILITHIPPMVDKVGCSYPYQWGERDFGSDHLINKVFEHKIDYVVCGRSAAKRMKEFLPQIDITTKISIPIPQAWGVRHNSPILRDSLNIWLERVKNSDRYKAILNKYGF